MQRRTQQTHYVWQTSTTDRANSGVVVAPWPCVSVPCDKPSHNKPHWREESLPQSCAPWRCTKCTLAACPSTAAKSPTVLLLRLIAQNLSPSRRPSMPSQKVHWCQHDNLFNHRAATLTLLTFDNNNNNKVVLVHQLQLKRDYQDCSKKVNVSACVINWSSAPPIPKFRQKPNVSAHQYQRQAPANENPNVQIVQSFVPISPVQRRAKFQLQIANFCE